MKAVTPIPSSFAAISVPMTPAQFACAKNQTSRNLSGSRRMNGTMKTTSVAAGGSPSIHAARRRLSVSSGIHATARATIGARRSHSQASNKKMRASRIQSGRNRRRVMPLHMDRALAHRQGGFLHSFGERRVGVTGAGDVFGGGAEFHRHRRLGDHVAGVGPEDVHAEH